MSTERPSNGVEGKHDGPVHYMGCSGDATYGGDRDKPELQPLNDSVVMETRVDTSVSCDVTNGSMMSPNSGGDAASVDVDLTHASDKSEDEKEESLATEQLPTAMGGDVTDVTIATVTEREREDIRVGSERGSTAEVEGVGEGGMAEQTHETASLSDDQVGLSAVYNTACTHKHTRMLKYCLV